MPSLHLYTINHNILRKNKIKAMITKVTDFFKSKLHENITK